VKVHREATPTGSNGAEPAPLEDPANVDARRAAVGLGPLDEYLKPFRDHPLP